MQSTLIRTLMICALAGLLMAIPAFGQEPPEDPPGSAYGADTQFTVTLGDTINFTITAVDSIDAAIHAFSTRSLEITLEGVTGVASTQITVSGLTPGVSLFKTEDDLRNHTVIIVDDLGTYSWLQDLTESHSILINSESSTWYLDDTGWNPQGIVTQYDHTYSAWYKLDVPGDDIPYPDRHFVLETYGPSSAWAASYGLRDWGSGDIGNVYTLTGSHSAPNVTFTGACGSQWHNILVTYNATNAEQTVYLDGAFVTTMASGNPLHETYGLMIGAHRDGYGRNFNGHIDDVAFWDRVLTPAEIAAIQQDAVADVSTSEVGLVAYWNFDIDFTATHGGSAFDGTPVNGPVIDTYGKFNGSVRFERASSQWVQVDEPVLFQDTSNTFVPGTWEPVTKMAVLTEDVFETIQITGTGITLDGGGYQINSANTYGIYIPSGNGVTVRNAHVINSSYGIYCRTPNTIVENSSIHGGYGGIRAWIPNEIHITNNDISGTYGIRIDPRRRSMTNCTILDNRVDAVRDALFIQVSSTGYGNTIRNNTFRSREYRAIGHWYGPVEIYNNNFISDVGRTPYFHSNSPGIVLNLPAPTGGNYWNTWTGPDEDGDGFVDIPYNLGSGVDYLPYTTPDGWLITTVTLSGTVSSDCGGALAGITVELHGSGGELFSTVTGEDGFYTFPDLDPGIEWDVTVVLPDKHVAVAPEAGTYHFAELSEDTVADFALGCLFDLSGAVASDCQGPMEGIEVTLDTGDDYPSALTAADGSYLFEDLHYGSTVELTCILPLGFHAADPVDGHRGLTVTQDENIDFGLECVTASGSARGMGYWKHQANVYVRGRGNAHESEEDMTTNFPEAIFGHFHENDLNGIAVEGVTYMGSGEPLDLATIQATLTVNGGQNMPARAKQHYLAFLLNVASGKILTYTEVSEDEEPRTASQALQYIADLINDGDADNDELAKDISETMNEAQLLAAGVIPDNYSTIYYSRPAWADLPLLFSPNPGGPYGTSVSFGMPITGHAELAVYDVTGRKVVTLHSGEMESGRCQIPWRGKTDSGQALAQGVYFARLVTPEGVKTAKFVHLVR